jgi:hypothetical protein
MKSRQKGKKKGSSKERVFGCDLREHLQHSGQEGKEVNWNGAAGWLDCHADANLVFSVGQNELLGNGQWPRITTPEI